MGKLNYLLKSISEFSTEKSCPYCKGNVTNIVDRKYFFTTLRECSECKLNFRHPKDSISFNKKFYQKEYKQEDSITTDLPSEEQLKIWLQDNFKTSQKDFSKTIDVIKSLTQNKKIRVLDFGANWGYTSYQFRQAGFDVVSYEISESRAKFGKNLGVDILTDMNQIEGKFDVVFSSHVIEHLPDINNFVENSKKWLTQDGIFACYSPNGSNDFKIIKPAEHHKSWGEVHPNLLSDTFYKTIFKDMPYVIGSSTSDLQQVKNWNGKVQTVLDLSGGELFIHAKLNQKLV